MAAIAISHHTDTGTSAGYSSSRLFPIQYRTFDHIYTVKVKGDSSLSALTLKVYSLSQEPLEKLSISKKTASKLSEGESTLLHMGIAHRSPTPLLQTLFRTNLLRKETLLDLYQGLFPETQIDALLFQEAFSSLMALIEEENPHGHSVDGSEVRTTVTPFADLIKSSIVRIAFKVIQEMFKALDQSQSVPPIYLLYAALAKMGDDDFSEVILILKRFFGERRRRVASSPIHQTAEGDSSRDGAAEASTPRAKEQTTLLLSLYLLAGDIDGAFHLLSSDEPNTSDAQERRQKVIDFLKEHLLRQPHDFELYSKLASLLPESKNLEKAHIFLKGALHAVEKGEHSAASRLVKDAQKLCPKGPTLLDLQIEFESKKLLQEDKKEELKASLQSIQDTYPSTAPQYKTLEELLALIAKMKALPAQDQMVKKVLFRSLESVEEPPLGTYSYFYGYSCQKPDRKIEFRRGEATDPTSIYVTVLARTGEEWKKIAHLEGEAITVDTTSSSEKIKALRAKRRNPSLSLPLHQILSAMPAGKQDAILSNLDTWSIEIINELGDTPTLEKVVRITLFRKEDKSPPIPEAMMKLTESTARGPALGTYIYTHNFLHRHTPDRKVEFRRKKASDPASIYASILAQHGDGWIEISHVEADAITVDMTSMSKKMDFLKARSRGESPPRIPDKKLFAMSIEEQDEILSNFGAWRIQTTNAAGDTPYFEKVVALEICDSR